MEEPTADNDARELTMSYEDVEKVESLPSVTTCSRPLALIPGQ